MGLIISGCLWRMMLGFCSSFESDFLILSWLSKFFPLLVIRIKSILSGDGFLHNGFPGSNAVRDCRFELGGGAWRSRDGFLVCSYGIFLFRAGGGGERLGHGSE